MGGTDMKEVFVDFNNRIKWNCGLKGDYYKFAIDGDHWSIDDLGEVVEATDYEDLQIEATIISLNFTEHWGVIRTGKMPTFRELTGCKMDTELII
jgi:hypothetical protein